MPRRTLESLGRLVREKRGARRDEETAAEIGIGTATLMEIETGVYQTWKRLVWFASGLASTQEASWASGQLHLSNLLIQRKAI